MLATDTIQERLIPQARALAVGAIGGAAFPHKKGDDLQVVALFVPPLRTATGLLHRL